MKLHLIVRAKLRDQLRWARQHVYFLLVLAPLVLGLSYLIAARLIEYAAGINLSGGVALLLSSTGAAALVGLSLSRTSAELFHVRQPEAVLESLPVGLAVHVHAAVASRVIRLSLIGVAALVARSLIYKDAAPLAQQPVTAAVLLVALMSIAEVWAALNWIHWSHLRRRGPALGAIASLLPATVIAGALLVLIVAPKLLPSRFGDLVLAAGMSLTLALGAVALVIHRRWRASDVEFARRLQPSGGLSLFRLRALGRRRLGEVVWSQLARDLQMTLRAFSSAVYVVLSLLIILFAGLIVVLSGDLLPAQERSGLDATWLPEVMAAKIGCVLMTATQSALAPVLVAYELPHWWLERSAGTTGLDMWRAKLWYARLVSAIAPAMAWCAGLLTGAVPGYYLAPLLAECVWLWWLVSSLMGSLSFEMPARPGTALSLMVIVGVAVGLSGASLWPFGLVIYPWAMRALTDRGRKRARYYMITEAD